MAATSKVVRNAGRRRPPNAGKGRKKGVPNKVTASVKAALMEAFDLRGGVPALLTWAAENPSDFYKLWGRLAPQEMQVAGELKVPLTIRVVRE